MKKSLLLVPYMFCCLTLLWTEQYQIKNVVYNIDGRTKEYSLEKALNIDYNRIFTSEKELQNYVAEIKQRLTDQRVLETGTVIYEVTGAYNSSDNTEIPQNTEETDGTGVTEDVQETSILPVTLHITAKDTWNIIPIPYPRYDSNTGVTLKIKVKDYNFLGSMSPLDFELLFLQEDEGKTNKIGAGIEFKVPFPLGIFHSYAGTDTNILYTIGADSPSFDMAGTFGISYDFGPVELKVDAKQIMIIDPEKRIYGDYIYGTEFVQLSAPIIILKTDTVAGNLVLTPLTSVTYNWDLDGMQDPDLVGPILDFGYNFTLGKVNWMGNFRRGFDVTFTQAYQYNFFKNDFDTRHSLKMEGYYNTKYVAFAARTEFFTHYNIITQQFTTTSSMTEKLRGVFDAEENNGGRGEQPIGFIFNFDMPIKVVQTDWCGWGEALFKKPMPSWFRIFDFELQFAPFIDMALYKPSTGKFIDIVKEGFYTAGGEIILYPNKMRSIQVRGSIGIDISSRIFKQEWRTKRGPEIEVGIGLFY